jgi:dTDP-4-amino-4,6-dideoxygalactose transaminase
LPFALPNIEQEEIDEVVNTLKSNWITTGPKAKKFEDDFLKLVSVKHAVAVNSCTAALHLGFEAVGIKKGDKVITSPFTFTASCETIRYLGADPLFADINAKTFNIDPKKIEQIFENKNFDASKIKAILPIHFVGQACDMTAIIKVAKKYNLKIIEDADWYYEIIAPGFKYNMPDISAAIGIHQLKKANQFRKQREKIAHQYNDAFQDVDEIEIPYMKAEEFPSV